jgi:hypothetical protein
VFKNGVIDWVIATDPEHAARVWCEHTGYSLDEYVEEFGAPADEWEQVPDDETISIRDYWDEPTREELDLTKTAAEWAAHEGKPCFLCSTEY